MLNRVNFTLPASRHMYHPETPSRVLRQIQELGQASLPDLPDLPSELASFSETDAETTFSHSPVKLPPQLRGEERENHPPSTAVRQQHDSLANSSPYTSTPAPTASYHMTQSTIVPTSAQSGRGNDTTATIVGPARTGTAWRAGSPSNGVYAAPEAETDEDEPTFGAGGMGELERRKMDDSRDEMVVLSGSGGEDDLPQSLHALASAPTGSSAELSELPPARPAEQDETEDRTSFQSGPASEDEGRPCPHPLDALGGIESLPATKPTSPPSDAAANILPESLTPLRHRDETVDSSVASPEIGRKSSPRHSPHHSLDQLDYDATPARAYSKSPSPALTHATPKFDSPLALLNLHEPSTPMVNQSAAQRRAQHVLTTLRSTAKPRFARGTPHPLRSVRKPSSSTAARSEDEQEERTSSSFASDHSSNDLTTFHKANTSLPSGGTADIGSAGGPGARFDGAKLNAYLHSLNTHLTEENQSLVKTLQRTTKDVERLQSETRRLEDTIREMSVAGGISVDISTSRVRSRTESIAEEAEDGGEHSRVEMLGKELEGLVHGQHKIRGLQDRLGDELGDKDAASRIRELEEEVERANAQLADKDDEIHRLRDRVVRGGVDSNQSMQSTGLQREVFDLKDQLDDVKTERDVLRADLDKLQADFAKAGEASSNDFAALQRRTDELLAELEEKDVELDGAKKQMEEQESEFADKMEELEKELCRVMEEQEAKVERARAELEAMRAEDEEVRLQEREKFERMERERDELEHKLLEGGSDVARDMEDKVHALREQVATLEEETASLRSDIAARDEELVKMQEELEAAEQRVDELEHERTIGPVDGDVDELRQQLRQRDEELKQLEDALDDSAQQLVDFETVLAEKEEALVTLRVQLVDEQEKRASLETRLSQLSVPKAKSPLANEVFNHERDGQIAALEEELEAARKETDDLRQRLAAGAKEDQSAILRDMEIKQLETDKVNLEDRVKSLRQQASMQFSPNRTPDKSFRLRPLPAVFTPKTPGQLFGNTSAWSPNSTANETISPLLAQIHELENVIDMLKSQLSDANAQIDNKLERLEAAGSGTISLAGQLSDAQSRIAQLEDELERLLGAGGSLERVRTRLSKIHCPECQASFDANKSVQLRISRSGVTLSESSMPSSTQSLKASLASVNAKLDGLRVENEVLQGQASRSKDLVAEKAALQTQYDALQRELRQARDEIAVLETDLRTERSKLRSLSTERAHAGKAKAALDATKADQAAIHAQLERQIAEIQSLRDTLHTKEAEQRLLQDERGDILRGVANLQADLNRVRQDAVSLGLDLAAVRKERDELGRKKDNEDAELVRAREELSIAKRKLGALEQQVAKHVCSQVLHSTDPASPNVAELRAKHKSEVKGLLVLTQQLKVRVSRELAFRAQAAAQKRYLENVVAEKQATIDSIFTQLQLPSPAKSSRSKPTLRSIALVVVSLSRMSRLAREWKELSAPKKRLRDQAYPEARGRPFPG
ncbi:prefoldin and Pericentrin/AKAP-450 centrosomal targeting domain protein [Rhodotorula toruloides]|uniref:Prefoldin and Pericentrin/AKAP-450 centrosomal targeting domain protein n=1 Tax=Rhodotorula toruloides TaxID=5286 RepID=A0A511KBL0_RHOTO|nr:prefoldin and Pericentrin/AKAP-450 centrosomal targeting domain protein [Rhodotorula toruloides]